MLYLGILTVFPQQVRVSQMHTSFVLLDRILISNSMDVLRPYHLLGPPDLVVEL